MSDLLKALLPVSATLDRLGLAYLLGGSIASSLHGMARSTMDIDLVAELGEAHIPEFVSALSGDYYVDADMIREAIRDRSSFNLVHQATMFKVDVFLPKGRLYDREAMRRRRPVQLSEDSPEVSVATAEDIVLAKLEWFERGGRASERQWSDVLGILRMQDDALDAEYLRRWAAELGLAELLSQAESER